MRQLFALLYIACITITVSSCASAALDSEIMARLAPRGWVFQKDTAINKGRAENKMVLLLAGRETCDCTPYVRDLVLEKKASPAIKNLLKQKYVLWYVDVDLSPETVSYSKGMGYFNLPFVCVIDPENPYTCVDRTSGPKKGSHFYSFLRKNVKR